MENEIEDHEASRTEVPNQALFSPGSTLYLSNKTTGTSFLHRQKLGCEREKFLCSVGYMENWRDKIIKLK